MDELNALPDQTIIRREYRDQPAGIGLQYEAGHQSAGNTENRGDDPGIRSFASKKITLKIDGSPPETKLLVSKTRLAASYHTASAVCCRRVNDRSGEKQTNAE